MAAAQKHAIRVCHLLKTGKSYDETISAGLEIFREPIEHDGFCPQFSLRWNYLKKNHQFSDTDMSRQDPHDLRPQWYR